MVLDKVEGARFVTIGNDGTLNDKYTVLLKRKSPLKVKKRDKNSVVLQNHYYKVKIVPLAFFSDDYSGNQPKQFNLYESWLVYDLHKYAINHEK
jgi:hypothetical protein